MLESGTPAVLKIETIGSLGSAGVPESQNHELYYGRAYQLGSVFECQLEVAKCTMC